MKQLLTLFSFLLFFQILSAQDRPYRQYATQKVHDQLLSENPEMAGHLAQIEDHIAQFGQSGVWQGIDTVAIIFHLFGGPGTEPVGEEKVLMQLEMLNRDYGPYEDRKKEYELEKVSKLADLGVDMDIFFCLADPSVQPIRYIQSDTDEWGIDDGIKNPEVGGSAPHQPESYLNIWVAEMDGRVSGYAQMPGGSLATDGIVIDRSFFADGAGPYNEHYNKGITLTHLVGSYLGLYELWDEATPCGDDKVDDTPVHNSPNMSPGAMDYHESNCPGSPTEMTMNFMDNTDDVALNMFTAGQKVRVKANLSEGGARSGLAQGASGCGAEGLDIAPDRSAMMATPNSDMAMNHLSVFPNPARDEVTVAVRSASEGFGQVTVFNAQGALLMDEDRQLPAGHQQMIFDCRDWPAGAYYVKVLFGDGTSLSQSLTIDR